MKLFFFKYFNNGSTDLLKKYNESVYDNPIGKVDSNLKKNEG